MSENKLVEKWVVEEYVYENGEVVCSHQSTTGFGKEEKEIHFDTEDEAEEYIDRYVEGEFRAGRAYYMSVYEENGVNYKVLKDKRVEEEVKRKLYLKPCPFCGKAPIRDNIMAKCVTCNIILEDKKWNRRGVAHAS